jgi:hypothetical protein
MLKADVRKRAPAEANPNGASPRVRPRSGDASEPPGSATASRGRRQRQTRLLPPRPRVGWTRPRSSEGGSPRASARPPRDSGRDGRPLPPRWSGRRVEGQRQEGNGRGDAVRLSTRGILRRVVRRGETPNDSSSGFGPAEGRTGRKRGEPQDRQWDATSPRPRRGASCRGGEKPRGWNRSVRMAPDARRSASVDREWTRRRCVGGGVNPDESHERKVLRHPLRDRELRRRGQDQECRTTDHFDRSSRW